MKQFRLLGINDDESQCSLCGRAELKCVWWLENTETQETFCLGSSCARKMLKVTAKELREWKDSQVTEQTNAAYAILRDCREAQALRQARETTPGDFRARYAVLFPLSEALDAVKSELMKRFPAAERHRLSV